MDTNLAKLRLLQMHYESGVGHIGGNLSCLDIMITLFTDIMTTEDVFVLSKGHAAGAYYIAQWVAGTLCESCLASFHKDGTNLSGHVSGTGSLGHGLGIACGIALAKKLKNEPGNVYCLLSDGEWEEGSNWESLQFIVNQDLHNIKLYVDCNGLQGFKHSQGIATLKDKIGCYVGTEMIDGHNIEEIKYRSGDRYTTAFLCKTIKGKGVSFMENNLDWHYLPMTSDQYSQAIKEVLNAAGTS